MSQTGIDGDTETSEKGRGHLFILLSIVRSFVYSFTGIIEYLIYARYCALAELKGWNACLQDTLHRVSSVYRANIDPALTVQDFTCIILHNLKTILQGGNGYSPRCPGVETELREVN